MSEMIDRRILAALLPVDAVTRLPLGAGVQVSAQSCRTVRNSRGYVVLLETPGLRDYARAFDAPAVPAVGSRSLTLRVEAPGGHYLPRVLKLSLPRDPARVEPGAVPGANSILTPVEVELFPAPSAQTAASWAALRVTVLDSASKERLPWAWVEVWDAAGNPPAPRARGMADARGEGLVPVPGIPPALAQGGGEGLLTTEIEVRVQVGFDAHLKKIREKDLQPGWRDPNHDYQVDPDALKTPPLKPANVVLPGAVNSAITCKLAAGQALAVQLLVNV